LFDIGKMFIVLKSRAGISVQFVLVTRNHVFMFRF